MLRAANAGARPAGHADSEGGDLRAHLIPGGVRTAGRRHPLAQRRAAGSVFGDVHYQPDRGRDVPELPGQRLAEPSEGRRTPAADASREAIRGRLTCGGRPIPLTGRRICRWPRGFSSSCELAVPATLRVAFGATRRVAGTFTL